MVGGVCLLIIVIILLAFVKDMMFDEIDAAIARVLQLSTDCL